MGQSVTVIEKPSARGGLVRFETNRPLSGMGHELYRAGGEIVGDRPTDVLARRLFDRGGIESVHVNGNVITLSMAEGAGTDGITQIIEDLFIFYRPD
ncbi:MAG: hypothetical protein DCC48_04705 [Acidobacteria bacterium]|nr:MAG: hypothetical protein DCC48_04705 [Acidobacteriota bacterium]